MHKKAATVVPWTTIDAQKSSDSGAPDHQQCRPKLRRCTKKQQRCYLTPPTVPKKAAKVVPGGSKLARQSRIAAVRSSNVDVGESIYRMIRGINGLLVADGGQPPSVV
jgi:hypothetical protein